MSKIENSIGWCDATINAVTGCDKVSPGCKNCYAEAGTRARVLRAQGIETWGKKGVRHPVNFVPVFRRLNKLCICDKCHETNRWLDEDGRMKGYQCFNCGAMSALRRIRLFSDSNSDWLDDRWPIETFVAFLDAIRLAPNVDVILLTKRIELFIRRMESAIDHLANEPAEHDSEIVSMVDDWMNFTPPANVFGLVSVENQKCADERIPLLLETSFAVRGISAEPLLEDVDLSDFLPHYKEPGRCKHTKLGWVIVGGESGTDRRDCGVEAVVSVHDQCARIGVPVWVKQDCAFKSGQQGRIPDAIWSRKEFPAIITKRDSMSRST